MNISAGMHMQWCQQHGSLCNKVVIKYALISYYNVAIFNRWFLWGGH